MKKVVSHVVNRRAKAGTYVVIYEVDEQGKRTGNADAYVSETCPACNGGGAVGRMNDVCPICKGKKVIWSVAPLETAQAWEAAQFDKADHIGGEG